MDRFKTPRLFYGRFPYRIAFEKHTLVDDPDFYSGWTLHSCKKWLAEQSIDHKIYSKVRYADTRRKKKTPVSLSASLFLYNRKDVDLCLARYPDSIVSITEPIDDTHVDMMRQNHTMIMRDRLYYGRYRYCVIFRRTYGDTFTELEDWLFRNFPTEDFNSGDVFRWSKMGWDPRLYIEKDEDLALVKMSWSEIIKKVSVAMTWEELG